MTGATGRPIRVVRTNTGTYLKTFQEQGVVGIDFNVDEDLSSVGSSMLMRQVYLRWNPDDGPNGPIARGVSPTHSAGINTGCLWRFLTEIQPGDPVIVPDGYDWLVGEIAGGYAFRAAHDPRHCRPVSWSGHIAKARLAPDTQQALTSWLAYFTVWPGEKGYEDLAAAVEAALGAGLASSSPPAEVPANVEARLDRLERIIGALLAQAEAAGRMASTLTRAT